MLPRKLCVTLLLYFTFSIPWKIITDYIDISHGETLFGHIIIGAGAIYIYGRMCRRKEEKEVFEAMRIEMKRKEYINSLYRKIDDDDIKTN